MDPKQLVATLGSFCKGYRYVIVSIGFSCLGAFLVGWAVKRYFGLALAPRKTSTSRPSTPRKSKEAIKEEGEKEANNDARKEGREKHVEKEKTLYEETLRVFSTHPSRLPIHVDLPRLARRIKVIGGKKASDVTEEDEEDADIEDVKKAFLPTPVEADTEEQREKLRMQLLYRLISSVTRTLERGPFVGDFEEKLQAMLSEEGSRGDVGMGLSYLFNQTDAYETRMMRLFKAIQQRVIFSPAFAVKRKVQPLGLMTKDLHTPQAWRIFVDFTQCENDIITVTHVRRECSSDPTKYFEVEWEFEMSFDEQLHELRSAELNVTNLEFDLKFDPHLRKEVEDLLLNAEF